MRRTWLVIVVLVLARATVAAADPADPEVASSDEQRGSASPEQVPPPPEVPTPPPPRELTAADVAAAPLPGDESGRTDPPEHDSAARIVARGALFIPRYAVDVVLSPIYGALWVRERYQLEDLYYRTFFNADRTIGLFPTATYESGYGVSAGMRFIDKDLFGEQENIALQAMSGAVSGASSIFDVQGQLHTGNRLGWLELGIEGNYDQRPDRTFYGLGNGNASVMPVEPIDPRTSDASVKVRYSYHEARALGFASARLATALHLRATGSVTNLDLGRGNSGPAIDEVYDPAGLVGFNGLQHAYGELELRFDNRGRATRWEPQGLDASGWLASAYAGRLHRLDGGVDYWRYGVEGQTFWRLGMGPRVIALRLRGDAVSGSRGDVPFIELPALGGAQFLRGYDFERFRDRVAGLATAEYEWDLGHLVTASLFVDAGRVFPSLSDLTLQQMRVGYGAGLAIYNGEGFVLEGSIASSTDGGLFLNLVFNPVFRARPRWR